jgi:hypothetical protein
LTRWRPRSGDPRGWIPWTRLVAAPFALADAGLEDFPPGHQPWAFGLAAALAAGAVALVVARGAPPGAALAFDVAVVSGFVCLYGFEPNSPVRLLFVLTALESGLVAGRAGAIVTALASAPALAVFEWRTAARLDEPFDPGHVLGPVGIQIAVGLAVGTLARRRSG